MVKSTCIPRARSVSGSTGVLTLFLLLPAPSALAQFPPDSFGELQQTVVEFEAGTRSDVLAAECRPGSPNPLTCPGDGPGERVTIPDSGWKIKEACYAIFDQNQLSVGFDQVGVIGDADGNGDPNTGSTIEGVDIPDDPVLGSRDLYSVQLDENLPTDSVDYEINVPLSNVGDYTPADFASRARSEDRLCLIRAPGVDPPLAGPSDLGCVDPQDLGRYWAGTTGLAVEAPAGSGKNVSREVMYFVEDLATLPMTRNGDGIFPKFIRMRSGSAADTCQEDSVDFIVVTPCVEVEKNAGVECSDQERAAFHATFDVTNCGGADLDEVVLEDTVLGPRGLGAPTCRLDGEPDPLPVDDLGGGSFRARLGPLPTDDGVGALLDCQWPGTSFRGEEELEFMDSVKVTGTASGRMTTDTDRDGAVALRSGCVVDGKTLKEHDGVGFDNALSLTRTLPLPPPFDDRSQFGSGVNPGGLDDVDVEEIFTAEGAVPVADRPGTFQTIPRVIEQGFLRPGSRARFQWRILVSKGTPDNFAGLEVTCSLCAELAQARSPASTFTDRSTFGRGHRIPDLVLGNRPLTLRVTQIGREPQHFQRFESDLDARSIPGLVQLILREDGEIAFLGCKPTAVLIDPFSNNEPLLKNDLIVVQINVPETERARLFADPTSCEISYLHAPPSR